MSRRLEPTDVAAIEKVRAAFRENSNSSNPHEEKEPADDTTLDPLYSDLLLKDKITNLRIVGHELVAPSTEGREFASYEMEVSTVDLSYRFSRRFSEFHQLYRQVRKSVSLKCEFPPKVYNPFVSSTSPAVVEQRSSKLHFFLQEVLNHVRASRDPAVTSLLFSFLALKEHYDQKQLTPSYKKCNSEKLAYYRMLSLKPSLSEGLHAPDQNSLEFKLFLLASNGNSQKCLRDIEELLKTRRAKLSLEEIKTLFVGDGECPGLLRYGLTNSSETNRVGALEILLGLLLPQRNPHSERFERVLDRLLTEEWRVGEVSMMESAPFKVLYFRLLSLYCDRMEREHARSETALLRDLFLFHLDLLDDYSAWKKVHERENGLRHSLTSNAVDHARKIDLTEFEEDTPQLLPLLSSQTPTRRAYVSQANSLLVFYFESECEVRESHLLQWNRLISNVTVDEYTSVVRASLGLGRKRIGLRVRFLKPSETGAVLQAQRNLVQQVKSLEEARGVVGEATLLFKEEYPAEFESEFTELTWLSRQEGRSRVLIAVHFAAGLAGTGTSIDQLARDLFEDIASRFPL